jgi:pyruvate formate lyase activating enzyme
MHDAILYEKVGENLCCHVCLRHCVIAAGARGQCGTREHRDGRLYTLIYDRVSAVGVDPIEKKPLYHFYPGSQVFSLGSLGCSFTCPGCQNWQISRGMPLDNDPALQQMTPSMAVASALRAHARGICWTYNDPAIWIEHTLESARLAKEAGLYTAYVTNGTATREHLDLLGPYLDAYRVDIKACSSAGYQAIAGFSAYRGILEGVQYAKEHWGMHVECVTNVTPTVNDSDLELQRIAHWIATALGIDTPWHVTRFYPYEGLSQLPATPLAVLNRACAIGEAEGLRYIYLGNVPGDSRQHTYCPSCGNLLIRRSGFTVTQMALSSGRCPQCGTAIAGVWGKGEGRCSLS